MNKISLAEAIPIIEKIVDHNNPEHVGVLATLRWIASLSPQGPILPVVPVDPSDELDRDLHFLSVMLDGAPKCQGVVMRARVQLRTQENEIQDLKDECARLKAPHND